MATQPAADRVEARADSPPWPFSFAGVVSVGVLYGLLYSAMRLSISHNLPIDDVKSNLYTQTLELGYIQFRPALSHRKEHPTMLKLMNKTLASGFALTLMATLPAGAYTGQDLSKQAKIGISEARAIALRAHSGKIIDEELEKETGGSGLRYSFDVRSGNVTYEVGVDAMTGKLLENAKEGPNPD
jgi:hypothetical protein